MAKFRKRPVIVDAWQWDGTIQTLHLLTGEGLQTRLYTSSRRVDGIDSLEIATVKGFSCVSEGDWIIKDAQGEFDSCCPDTFRQDYSEEIQDDTKSSSD